MTLNPKTLELRNLLPGSKPEGVQCCGVCGKPHSRLDKDVKELPIHKRALAEDFAGKFRNLSKALGGDIIMDFVDRQRFNGQLEWLRDMLTQAREEHDAFVPPVKETDKAKTVRLLTEMCAHLGIPVKAEDASAPTVLLLVENAHRELGKLMEIKREVAAL